MRVSWRRSLDRRRARRCVENASDQKVDEDGGEHHNIAVSSHYFVDENGFFVIDVPDLES